MCYFLFRVSFDSTIVWLIACLLLVWVLQRVGNSVDNVVVFLIFGFCVVYLYLFILCLRIKVVGLTIVLFELIWWWALVRCLWFCFEVVFGGFFCLCDCDCVALVVCLGCLLDCL